MLRQVIIGLVCMGLLWQASTKKVSAQTIPPYNGLVADQVEVLSPQFEAELSTELEQLAEQNDKYEVVVVTIESVHEEPAAVLAKKYYDEWKIGKTDNDNGALLLIAIDDKKVYLYTGEGVKKLITETEANTIIREQIDPSFQQNDYEQGIKNAIAEIRQQVTDPMFGNINPINQSPKFMQDFLETLAVSGLSIISILFFSYFSAWYGRNRTWWPGGLVGAGLGTLLGGAAAGIFFGAIGLAMDYLVTKKNRHHA